MKSYFLFCLMGLLALTLFAQSPVLLRSSQHLDFQGINLEISNSAMMVFWNDTRSGSSNIYSQKISADGTVLWQEARPVTSGALEKRILSAIVASDGNVVVTYNEFSTNLETNFLKIQKLSLAGQCLWQDGGMVVTSSSNFGIECSLVPNNVGGAYTAHFVSGGVSVKNFNANGVNQWPDNMVFPQSQMYDLDALTDGYGGIILNVNTYSSVTGDGNYTLKINSEGDIVGNNPFISQSLQVPPRYSMIRNSVGDYFLYSIENNTIQYQKIDAQANLLLPAIVTQSLDNPADYIGNYMLAPATDGGLYVAVFGSQYYDSGTMYLDRLDANAQQVWDNQTVFPIMNESYRLSLDVNQDNDAWLCWVENTYSGSYNQGIVKAARVTPSGSPAFTTTMVGDETSYKLYCAVMAQNSQATFVWNDMLNEKNGIKCQLVNNSGSSVLEQEGRLVHWVLNGYTDLRSTNRIGNYFIYVYDDYRNLNSSKIYYQITDQNIERILEVNGRALNPDSEYQELYLDCLSLPNNRLAILYSVYLGGNFGLYLQEIAATGAKVHPGYGLLINDALPSAYTYAKLSYVDGDFVIAWRGAYNGNGFANLLGQRFHNNLPLWEAGGKLLVSESNIYPDLKGLKGNYLLFAMDDYNANTISLRALLLDNNGNPATGWPNNGIAMKELAADYYQTFSNAGLSGDNLVCFFADLSYLGIDTYAQKLSPEGTRLWGENALLLEDDEEWNHYFVTDAIYGDNFDFLMRPDSQDFFAMQRINQNGELQFPMPGISIDYAWYTTQEPKMIKYANGGYSLLFIGWEDQFGRINHRYVSPDGIVSDAEPLSIATHPNGFWSLETTNRENIGVMSYTDGNQYIIARGEAVPIASLWACRINAPSVSAEDQLQSPAMLVSSNYPNPFNPSTTIRYNQKEANPVKVEIYNAKGQLVKVLVNEAKASGEHEIVWNGTDDQGHSVASGVYLYKIQAGKYSNTKKMMLMK